MAGKSRSPHDRLMRALLADDGRGERLARAQLPPEVAALLADAPLTRVPGDFVDERLREHRTDALFRAELRDGRPVWLYVLLEHKSWRDPWAPLQMARYIIRIWTEHSRRKDARPGVLPPVIPILIHHGPEPWDAPLSVLDMVEAPASVAEAAPPLTCLLRDLRAMETGELPEDPEIRSVLAALAHVHDRAVADEDLHLILSGPGDGSDMETQVARYVAVSYGMDRERFEAALRRARPERWETLMGTVAEELVREGRAYWIAEGEAVGEATGKAETFLRQARLRFGEVPQGRAAEVRAADTATLDRWLDALLFADTLDEVFGSP